MSVRWLGTGWEALGATRLPSSRLVLTIGRDSTSAAMSIARLLRQHRNLTLIYISCAKNGVHATGKFNLFIIIFNTVAGPF